MKKRFIMFFILVIAFLPLLILVGCDESSDSNNTFYYDNPNMNIDGINLEINCQETSSQNHNLTITITATNTQLKDKPFNMSSCKIVNEFTEVAYDCSSISFGSTTLQYNVKKNFLISSVIPTSYQSENYYAKLNINNKIYCIKLYETPNELRDSRTVNIYIFSYPNYGHVDTLSIKDRRSIGNYVWEEDNHLYYCDKWYADDEREHEFSLNTKITQNISIYGVKKSNLQISGGYVSKINHVPQDGILVVDSVQGEMNISNYAFKNNNDVKEIYLPKTIKKIYYGNFEQMASLTTIHFAGTESEWNDIENLSSIPTNVSIIFNSKFQ